VIIADTSGLLAALDPDEQHHARCRAVVELAASPLVISPFVLCELDYLVLRKLGPDAEAVLLGDVASGAYQLAGMGPGDVAAARNVVMQYRDLQIGLADASVAVLAQRHRTSDIFTLDARHFRAMQTAGGGSYRLLPADS
jgi:predicted nucleic acid-binding protein